MAVYLSAEQTGLFAPRLTTAQVGTPRRRRPPRPGCLHIAITGKSYRVKEAPVVNQENKKQRKSNEPSTAAGRELGLAARTRLVLLRYSPSHRYNETPIAGKHRRQVALKKEGVLQRPGKLEILFLLPQNQRWPFINAINIREPGARENEIAMPIMHTDPRRAQTMHNDHPILP